MLFRSFVSPSAEEAYGFGNRHYGPTDGKVNVYPLWVRAETPFDYDNDDHVKKVAEYISSKYKPEDIDGRIKGMKLADKLLIGDWVTIESPQVQEAFKTLGFDSFYVYEGGKKNLAVFNANQVKSVTGNIGEFGEGKDIRFSLRKFDRSDLPTDRKPFTDRKSTRLNSSHVSESRMPSSA